MKLKSARRAIAAAKVAFVMASFVTMTTCTLTYSTSTGAAHLDNSPEFSTNAPARALDTAWTIANRLGGDIDATDLGDEDQVRTLAEAVRTAAPEICEGEFVEAHLKRMVDGKTIEVSIGQEDFQIELSQIGIPEGGETAAKEYLENALKTGQALYLEKNAPADYGESGWQFVWTEIPEYYNYTVMGTKVSTQALADCCLNAQMVRDGVATREGHGLNEIGRYSSQMTRLELNAEENESQGDLQVAELE